MARECVCAGDLRERVAIEACTEDRDEVGGRVEVWSTIATVWARVMPMSQRESWYRQQTNAAAAWKVHMRYRADLTTKHRIVWGIRVFEIRGVANPDERRRWLEIACDEIVAP
jgi:SPP1 family predicted phage head-tail adaptor